MARYIALLHFTERGATDIRKSTERAHHFNKAAAQAGVKVEGQFWTIGRYDGVLILNADSESHLQHCLVELAAQGHVRTETLRAFTDTEFDGIVNQEQDAG